MLNARLPTCSAVVFYLLEALRGSAWRASNETDMRIFCRTPLGFFEILLVTCGLCRYAVVLWDILGVPRLTWTYEHMEYRNHQSSILRPLPMMSPHIVDLLNPKPHCYMSLH